jgi:hypothetical protein
MAAAAELLEPFAIFQAVLRIELRHSLQMAGKYGTGYLHDGPASRASNAVLADGRRGDSPSCG